MVPTTRTTLVLIFATFFISHAYAQRRTCPPETRFAIGSFNLNPFRPEFIGQGITIASFVNNTLSIVDNFPPSLVGDNPSYIAITPPYLFTCNSVPDGSLTRLNFPTAGDTPMASSTLIPGQQPAHVSVVHPRARPSSSGRRNNPSGPIVVTANVNGGTVSSYIRGDTGMIVADTFTVPPELASRLTNPELTGRQNDPHPHMALPYRRGVIIPDLGADLVFYLRVSRRTARLSEIQRIQLSPGDGPRHAVAHRSGTLYIINELSRTISVLREGVCGSPGLGVCETLDILDNNEGPGTAAAIRVSSDNRFVYASVRLDQRTNPLIGKIAAFKLDANGMITEKAGEWSSEGVHPRDFFLVEGLNVDGRCESFVAIVNRDSSHLVLVRRNVDTGALVGGIAYELAVDTPTSVLPL